MPQEVKINVASFDGGYNSYEPLRAEHAYRSATEEAAQFVCHLGFGNRLSRTDVTDCTEVEVNTDMQPSNGAIEARTQ